MAYESLIGLAVICYFIYYYLTRTFDYWEKRHVAGPKPIPLFGTYKDIVLRKTHAADYMKHLYDKYPDEPVIGLFRRTNPVLLVKDPEILKDVLIKHFTTFPTRGAIISVDIDPLAQHLLYLNYERWKPMRRRLTPTFSSGKLKEMFYLINECADNFSRYMESLAGKNEPVECRKLAAKYTIDVIGVCAFGLNMNAVDDPDSKFLKYGRAWFANSWFNLVRRSTRLIQPDWLARLFKPIARNDEVINFFVHTITSTMEYRKKNNVRRNDFVDLLIDLKDNPDKMEGEELTDILLTAQAFVFFLAGFETSSTTISHAMYELACNPEIQDKLRQDIKDTLEKHGGKLNYDSVKEMKYLDKVVNETLRKYPPAFELVREAADDYTFANRKFSIDKGTDILISVYAIHHDPNIYPDPDKFDPERFDEEVANSRPPMTFLAFGDGPRNCIGKRFAENQTKLGLTAVVKNFRLDVCDKTFKEYEKQLNTLLLAPEGGIYLKINKLEATNVI